MLKKYLFFLIVILSILVNYNIVLASKIDSLPSSILQESVLEKIVFDTKPMTSEIKRLTICLYHELTSHYVKLGSYNNQKYYKDENEAEQERIRIYNDCRRNFPFLKLPPYNRQNYFLFLSKTLPKILAPYGIFGNPTYYGPWNKDGFFTTSEIIVSFFRIQKIEKRTVNFWDKKIDVDILFISDDLKIDGQVIIPHPFATKNMGGLTYYRNIIVNLESIDIQIPSPNGRKVSDEEYQKLLTWNETKFWEQLSVAPNMDRIAELSAYRMIVKSNNRAKTPQDVIDMIINHEAGHFIDFTYHSVLIKKEPVCNNKIEYQKLFHRNITDSEINPTLTSLRYDKDKTNALYGIIEKKEIDYSKEHKSAEDWILERIIDYVESNPEKYGFVISRKINCHPRTQIFFQLSNFLDCPEKLDNILDQIYFEHNHPFLFWSGQNKYWIIIPVVALALCFYRKRATKKVHKKNNQNKKRK